MVSAPKITDKEENSQLNKFHSAPVHLKGEGIFQSKWPFLLIINIVHVLRPEGGGQASGVQF